MVSKIANALLLLAAALVVLTLFLGVALLVKELSSGAFGWNAVSGAWIQAGLSVAAVILATLISRGFSKAVHNETLEREDRARERMIRRYLHIHEEQWTSLITSSARFRERLERFLRLLELQPWGVEFHRDQLRDLVEARFRAEEHSGKLQDLVRAATLDCELLAYLAPEDWDALVEGRNAIWNTAERLKDASAAVAATEPTPQQCEEGASTLRAAVSRLSEGRRRIVDVFKHHGMMKAGELGLPPITVNRESSS